MMPRHADRPCPGRNLPCVIVGAVVGLGLAGVAVAWLLVANRELWLEQFAVDRNLSAAALMGVVMLVPVLAFVKYPLRIFFSGIVAWTVGDCIGRCSIREDNRLANQGLQIGP